MDAGERPQPAAEEKRDADRRDQHHGRVLGHEKQREAEAAVFGMEPGGQFRLRFGKIKRAAVGLRNRRHQVDEESDGLHEDVPPARFVLVLYNLDHAQGVGEQDHAHDGDAGRHFVAHQLR